MRSFLLKLHYYLAFIFLLPLVISGATGMVLVFDHALDERLNPALLLSAEAPLAERHAIDFDRAYAAASAELEEGERISRLFVPRHEEAAILAETKGGSAGAREIYVNPQTYAVQGIRPRYGHLLRVVYDLHAHLLMPPAGDYVLTLSAASLALLSIGGIVNWLWHPSRRLQLRVKRKMFLRWWDTHRLAGAVVAAMLLLIALSGGTMAFLHSFGKGLRAMPDIPAITALGAPLSIAQMAALGQPLFPEARLSVLLPPATPETPWQLSFHQPAEPRTSKGMTHVWVDPYAGRVVKVDDPLARTGWQKWLVWAFPLHNGEWGGLPMRLLHWLMGFSLLLLAYTGTRSFLARRKPKPKSIHKRAAELGKSPA